MEKHKFDQGQAQTLTEVQEQLIAALREHPEGVSITFEKNDGSLRTMQATTNPALITENYVRTTDGPGKTPNPEQCNVFDLEKQAWRSFIWDNLVKASYSA